MKELYMIKIGGGSITDQSKPRTAKRGEIARLLSEIYEAKKKKDFDVIIGHGSGSFGHVTAKEYRVNEGLVNDNSKKGAILTKVVASELNFIVIDEAIKLEIPIFPFFPSSFTLANGKKLDTGFVDHIKSAMNSGFIPLVHGDVVIDSKQGVVIASTEEVMRFISTKIQPNKIILATDVDGIYDKDPTKYNDAKMINTVTGSNINEVLSGTGEAHKIDVTGGMKAKISLIYEIVSRVNGVGYIVNATKPGVVSKALLEEKNLRCTIIKP
jgi:isopentenyl phosphate kinase